ncbi:hypothetical protein KFL_001450070 [Klebsormidium nitens]|uniref:RRM domain-containing protein n=1 Tax=Klebsormidium nitens TaxID=105231 RepID=A0A1Y1HXH1_KLENI|nr:hypothetical protein KFL_001450070 [Klebsormidium nitens]|eukprot:GAQ83354.1 hypothetical protein KFL_001450070 [Klebsormidium nitens]
MAESAKEGGDPKDALDTELARFEAEMAELTTTPPPPPPAPLPPPKAASSKPLVRPHAPPPSVAPLPAPLPAPGPQPFYPPGPSGQFAPPGQYPPVLAQYPGPVAAPPLTQGQTLFERDMKALDPAELERVKAALAGEEPKPDPKKETKKRPIARTAAGEKWVDPTLAEWPENDFRLFCGNLGNEVNEDVLSKAFVKYSSFNMAKVIRDKRTGKTRGYGFVSFATQGDMFSALKEMQGKYVGNRPLILRKSSWEERTDAEAQKKKYKKQKSKHGPLSGSKELLLQIGGIER